jgi:exosome complex RNA-binding protein Rrp42 (RNase PH superfamily)
LGAQTEWINQKLIKSELLSDWIVAVSIGMIGEQIIVDPDFSDDLLLDADFNVIGTSRGDLIEVQGGAEKKPISQQSFNQIQKTAFLLFDQILNKIKQQGYLKQQSDKSKDGPREPFFTLGKQLSTLQKNNNQ